MPQTPHFERHFTSSESARDVVIGMFDGLTAPVPWTRGYVTPVRRSPGSEQVKVVWSEHLWDSRDAEQDERQACERR